MKEVIKETIKKYKINGKEYNSLEDLPEDIRKKIDQDNNGRIDVIEKLEKNPITRKWLLKFTKTEPTSKLSSEPDSNHSENSQKVKDPRALVMGISLLIIGGVILYYWFQYAY